MTDLPPSTRSVPGRLGVTARSDGGELVFELVPRPEVLSHGFVRASVIAFLIDAAAGTQADTDVDAWTLTSDMSVRMRPVRAPERIAARNTPLRQGNRSFTSRVDLEAGGELVGTGAVGFVRVPRREGDPPKPALSHENLVDMFKSMPRLDAPLREAAGIEVVDAERGVVQLEVTPALRNPAGTLQGAMVALVAEAAAEDLLGHGAGRPVVVTDLDIRYLGRAEAGPVRTVSRRLGRGPEAPVEVEIRDTSTGKTTTLVYCRAVPV